MAVPQSKQELLSEINNSFTKLLVDLESISEKDTNLIELEGHKKDTLMSIHNLVSYLLGWNELV